MIEIKKLNEETINDYLVYLEESLVVDTDNFMMIKSVDRQALVNRLSDPMFKDKHSLLAYINGEVAGRIEYHFYLCFQDGHTMCYIDWLYTLPRFRRKGVAEALFSAMENHCKENNINDYYLIRSNNENAKNFYKSVENLKDKNVTLMRKTINKDILR